MGNEVSVPQAPAEIQQQKMKQSISLPDQNKKIQIHFSDYSFFPDRYTEVVAKRPDNFDPEGHGHDQEKFPENNQKVTSFRNVDTPKINEDQELNLNQNQMLSKSMDITSPRFSSFVRMRTKSTSSPIIEGIAVPPTLSTHKEEDSKMGQNMGQIQGQGQGRKRAYSLGHQNKHKLGDKSSPRLYFFDYSMILDKDPRCAQKDIQVEGGTPVPAGEIRSRTSTGESVTSSEMEIKSTSTRRIRKYSVPSKYTFFDYTMIPDKLDVTSIQNQMSSTSSPTKSHDEDD